MQTRKSDRDAEFEHQIQRLHRAWKKSHTSRRRFAERRYLAYLYQTYWALRENGRLKRQLRQFRLGGTSAGGHEKPFQLSNRIDSQPPYRVEG